ncbi:hypothetical protein MOP93_21060 [Escherichia coli]|uniref:hypothetical protein n=1 Tax=Escherichia coli TaxID=562 RepID=UPI0035B5D62A|nr:hypothetical protein [Escherichia coli]
MLDIGRKASASKISDVLRQIDEIEKNTRRSFGLGGVEWRSSKPKSWRSKQLNWAYFKAEKLLQDILNSSINDYNKRQQEGEVNSDREQMPFQNNIRPGAAELVNLQNWKS